MFVCFFWRVRRDIYTYLRFELRFEVWVGREMGDGGRGKKKKREKEFVERMEFDLSRCLSLSLSLSLSLCYDMLYSRLLYNVIHHTLISHPSHLTPFPFPLPPNLHPHPHPTYFPSTQSSRIISAAFSATPYNELLKCALN